LPQTTINKAVNERLTQMSERARVLADGGHFAHIM